MEYLVRFFLSLIFTSTELAEESISREKEEETILGKVPMVELLYFFS